MALARKTSDIVQHQNKKAAAGRSKTRRDGFSGKTFESLTKPEKDDLLKEIAVKLGLIQDS